MVILLISFLVSIIVGIAVMILMVHTRRPPEGIKQWVRNSTSNHVELKKADNRSSRQVSMNQMLKKEVEEKSSPLNDVEALRRAASSLVDRNRSTEEAMKPQQSLPPAIKPSPKNVEWSPLSGESSVQGQDRGGENLDLRQGQKEKSND